MTGKHDELLLDLMQQVESGGLSPIAALSAWHDRLLDPDLDSSAVHADLSRSGRNGFAEVIYAEGKTLDDLRNCLAALGRTGERVILTRVSQEQAAALMAEDPALEWFERARILARGGPGRALGQINVLAAGTTDLPVAEEAAVTATLLGARVRRLYDVGVAGLHRLLGHREELDDALVQIVVAGMEGALPSVVGGLVSQPVIAVPTSVGYGASFHGLAALLGMLSSCAPGVVVVNIGNGFGAGYAACRMLASTMTINDDETEGSS